MAFDVIPAIDVVTGRLARPAPGGPEPLAAYGGDPMAAAEAFLAAGARWIHVVDLDLADTGEPVNLEVVSAVAALGARVQASGGVVSDSQVDRLLSAGAARVVLGSAALTDREGTAELVSRTGDALAVGIEVDGATIRPRGGGGTEMALWDVLGWLTELDVRRFVLTEVGRVARLSGPDLDGIWALATHTATPVIAAGGVRDIEDLRAIAALEGSVHGAIVGRALYAGGLDLGAAVAELG